MMNTPAHDSTETAPPKPVTEKRAPSAGEVVFDRVVYTGIGFGVNEASSLAVTDQFVYGKPKWWLGGKWFSKEGYDAISEGLAKTFKIKDAVTAAGEHIPARDKAGNLLLMVTLLSGGTALLLPMKWLEDNKAALVKKTNHVLDAFRGNRLKDEQVEARDEEVEQAIACSPRQSWPSMLLGRAIACAASVGTGTLLVGPQNNEKLMQWSEKALTGSLQHPERRDATHRYARLLSVETYSCAISSIALELASKLFAKRSTKVHDPEVCRITQGDPAEAAPPPKPSARPTGGSADPRVSYSEKISGEKKDAVRVGL